MSGGLLVGGLLSAVMTHRLEPGTGSLDDNGEDALFAALRRDRGR